MPGKPFPKITVVTPSFNQGRYLEQTIRSVLNQGYPNLEYILIDGKSSDNSLDIIRKYEKHLGYWVSERDRGQAHAINKGFERATGQILAYLNADDVYLPGAFDAVARRASDPPERTWLTAPFLAFGNARFSTTRDLASVSIPDRLIDWLDLTRRCYNPVASPSTFFGRTLWEQAGPLREDLWYCLDAEYWLRLAFMGYKPQAIERPLSAYRFCEKSKSCTKGKEARIVSEFSGLVKQYGPRLPARQKWIYQAWQRREGCWNLQTEALHASHAGNRQAAIPAFIKSIQKSPGALFTRRSLGCLKRILLHLS